MCNGKKQSLPKMNFESLLHNSVARYGRKNVYIGDDFQKSYADFANDIERLTSYFLNNGFYDKRIGIFASNSYEWVLLFATVIKDIGTIVPLDKELPAKELRRCIRRARIDFVFYDNSTKNIVEEIGNNSSFVHMDNILDFIKLGVADKRVAISRKNKDCAALFFTSGTTSESKIVMLSQGNLVSCAYASANAFKLKTSDRYYTMLPLHHTLTLMCQVLVPLTSGCSFCFNSDLKNMQKELCRYHPTALVVVPRVLEFMMNSIKMGVKRTKSDKSVERAISISKTLLRASPGLKKALFRKVHRNFGGKVRMIACGGAELDDRVFNYLDNMGFNIYQGYGLTESSPILTIRGMFVKDKRGVGKPLENVEIKISKPDNSGIGEIVAKAPQVMLGYYEDKAETSKVIKNGWLFTGDLGKILDSGNLEVVGRKKNVIITSNGKNIYPEELETLINYSEIVKESVVRGIKKNNGVQIIATIVPEEKYKGTHIEAKIAKLIEDINAILPSYKRINKFIVQEQEFEKTTTLKIKRRMKNEG